MSKLVWILAAAAAAVFALSGCSSRRSAAYADAEKYSVGEAEITEKIENIDLDWPSGGVKLVSHSGDALLLTEKAKRELPEELRVHWWVEGTTLHVKFAAPGAHLTGVDTGHKELTLTVPESLNLKDVSIRAASAEIDARGLASEVIAISTASGDVDLDCDANTIKLNSASGSIQLTQKDKAAAVSVNTVSGKISARLNQADKADFESTSGRIGVTAESIDALRVEAVSGAVTCELAAAPSECTVQTVSGRVNLALPEDSDFTAKIRTTSGNFDAELALKRSKNVYICGSGRGEMNIETTSGDISIRRK